MIILDAASHARGETHFLDDWPEPANLLWGAAAVSTVAHGRMVHMESGPAAAVQGVIAVYTADSIPGKNQIGGILEDEPLLASDVTDFIGQPIALVLADSPEAARAGAGAISATYEPLPAVLDPREAFRQNRLIAPPRTFSLGDVESAWAECDFVLEGRADSGGQEHVYLETQASMALPTERGGVRLLSATQSPTATQRIVARVLGLPMNQVQVEIPRLGGGFGGKEDQATAWAALAALGAWHSQRPVKIVLRRNEDMLRTGKRHPYSADFRIGLKKDGTIFAYQVFFYQNSGAAADLSPAILERTLFHAGNSYAIPNVRATAVCCRTHLPPNTAFRGFGAPQAMFVLESAIYQAAQAMKVDPSLIQEKNLLREGDIMPYGQRQRNCRVRSCWQKVQDLYDVPGVKERILQFNRSHRWEKKAWALMPQCFGISFTTTFLNQAASLVHVYMDGSVGISTGGVEMGQGVKSKIAESAARTFSIDIGRILVENTDTTRSGTSSPTAASTGADMNGHATRLACLEILGRLREAAAGILGHPSMDEVSIRNGVIHIGEEATSLSWDRLILQAYQRRVNLSARGFYTTPDIHFDRSTEKGEPFAYYSYGTALVEVTLDGLRGIYTIDSVKVVHDFGTSLHPLIDRGQAEGAIVQGLGWIALEELLYGEKGELLTHNLATYKVPDIHFAPPEIHIHFLEDAAHPGGLFQSKAIGEPPFLYGIGAYFALLKAMQELDPGISPFYDAPMTAEKMLIALSSKEDPQS